MSKGSDNGQILYPVLAIWQCSWIQCPRMQECMCSDCQILSFRLICSVATVVTDVKRNLNYQAKKLAKTVRIFVDIGQSKPRGHIGQKESDQYFPRYERHEVSHTVRQIVYISLFWGPTCMHKTYKRNLINQAQKSKPMLRTLPGLQIYYIAAQGAEWYQCAQCWRIWPFQKRFFQSIVQ